MFYRVRTIVAGIAQPEDDPVLVPARELAARCGAFLHLVHAPELPDLVWRERHTRVRPGPDSDCAYHPVQGPPGAAIVALAHAVSADLIIVGASRGHRLSDALFGSTARAVAREADAPVLVLRGHAPQHVSRVLLTTDLSPLNASAYEIGLDLVEALFPGDPALRALDVAFDDASLAPPLRGTMFDDLATDELNAFLRARRERKRPVEAQLRFGDPVDEITEEVGSWGADLVVLGTQGRTGAARVLLGSTAEAVARKVDCSVLLVPRKAVGRVTLPVPFAEMVVAPPH
jgi:nucleotide-binding universal stress UspA family protein